MTSSAKEALLELAEHWERQCSRYVNGFCTTRCCLMRGGYGGAGPIGGVVATCEEHETAAALRAQSEAGQP